MTGYRKIFIGFLMVVCAGAPAAENIVKSPVRVTGRTGTSATGNPIFYWGCASVDARFEGTSLGVRLSNQNTNCWYQVIIDGAAPIRFKANVKAETTYAVASNLTDTVHNAQLYRLTEGDVGWTEFFGFVLDAGKTLQAPPAAPPLKIEFYGDSITTGLGNEASDTDSDLNRQFQNGYMAYSAITARNLNAEIHCIAQQGIGVFVGWTSFTMPQIWNRIRPNIAGTIWDFNQWTPDIVVVNLLANDKTRISTLNPQPTEAEIIQYYVDFVSGVRAVYPNAHIVCALGGISATEEGSPWPGYIHQAVINMADSNISECMFPNFGITTHPRIIHHQMMADQLTAHIRSILTPGGLLFQL